MNLHITPSFNIDRLCKTASVLLFLVIINAIQEIFCLMFSDDVARCAETSFKLQQPFIFIAIVVLIVDMSTGLIVERKSISHLEKKNIEILLASSLSWSSTHSE